MSSVAYVLNSVFMSDQRVLIVDDEEPARQGLSELVAGWGYVTETAADGREALERIDSFSPLVVITDIVMPNLDGFQLLSHIREDNPQTAVILLTGQGSVDAAIRSVKEEGAFYYFEKPIDTRRLQLVLRKAAEYSSARRENELLRRQLRQYGAFGDMVGSSEAMREIYTLVEQVAPSSVSVLVTGESGTGKEMVARTHTQAQPALEPAVHRDQLRRRARDADGIRAVRPREGRVSPARRTDGSAALSLLTTGRFCSTRSPRCLSCLQAKLLRVLEDKKVRRLGSTKEMNVDVRVIAATNKDPFKAVQEGTLREDLLYRLNVITIKLPPLRDHRDDVPLLVQHMIDELSRRHAKSARLDFDRGNGGAAGLSLARQRPRAPQRD